MSSQLSKTVQYECYGDHTSTEPCSGHRLRVIRSLTSDTVSVEVDGEVKHVFDEAEFEAIISANESFDKR